MNGYYSRTSDGSINVVNASFYVSLSQTNLIPELLDLLRFILFPVAFYGKKNNHCHFHKRHNGNSNNNTFNNFDYFYNNGAIMFQILTKYVNVLETFLRVIIILHMTLDNGKQ